MNSANYDYEAEQSELERKMKVAQAMMGQGQEPLQTNLGWGVKQSPLAAVAKIMQAYFGQKMAGQLGDEQRALGASRKADAASSMEQFINGISAQAGQIDPGVQVRDQPRDPMQSGAPIGNNPSTYQPPSSMTEADAASAKRDAIIKAMSSSHPMLQQLGMMRAGEIGKKPEIKQHVVGGQLVEGVPGQTPRVAFDSTEKWGPVEQVGMDGNGKAIMGQKNHTGQIRELGSRGTHVNLNTTDSADQALAKHMGNATADLVKSSYEKTQDLPQKLATLQSVGQLLDDGMRSGPTADLTGTFMKVGELFGLKPDPATANSETFRGQMAQSALDIIKQLKPASDMDQRYAAQASGADPALAAQAIKNLISSAQAASANQLFKHSKMIERNANTPLIQNFQVPFTMQMDPKKFKQDLSGNFVPVYPKAATSTGAGKPMSLDDYLKAQEAQR